MKILVSSRFSPKHSGGLERVAGLLIRDLATGHSGWSASGVHAFSDRSRLAKLPLLGDIVASMRFALAAICRPWDVFIVNGAEYAWGPVTMGRILQKPVFVVWHGVRAIEVQALPPAHGLRRVAYGIFLVLERWLARAGLTGSATVAVGPNVADEIRSLYHYDGRIDIISNGVELPPSLSTLPQLLQVYGTTGSNFVSGNGQPDPAIKIRQVTDTFTVLWIGGTAYQKGLAVAIDACARARRAVPGLQLVVVGLECTGLGLTDEARAGVQWRGHVPPSEMTRLYQAAHVLLCPTRYEGCSMGILEALAHGIPVVCSAVTGWLVGDAGVVIDSYSSDDYAAALVRLTDPQEYRGFAKNTYARAREFTWESAVRCYQELVADRTKTTVKQPRSKFDHEMIHGELD